MPDPGTPRLRVAGLSAGYGDTTVVRDITLTVAQGELVGLLGANGAGKSTLLRAIAGMCSTKAGVVELDQSALGRRGPAGRVRMGLSLVPQGYGLFGGLTVEENLVIGAWRVRGREHDERMARSYEMFPILHARRAQPVEALSGGERAMLAIARGLMTEPRILLLDEPSLGLSPRVRREVLTTVKAWCAEGRLSCLVAEQDVVTLGEVADRWHVIRAGRLVYDGRPGQLTPTELRDIYLGVVPEEAKPCSSGGQGKENNLTRSEVEV